LGTISEKVSVASIAGGYDEPREFAQISQRQLADWLAKVAASIQTRVFLPTHLLNHVPGPPSESAPPLDRRLRSRQPQCARQRRPRRLGSRVAGRGELGPAHFRRPRVSTPPPVRLVRVPSVSRAPGRDGEVDSSRDEPESPNRELDARARPPSPSQRLLRYAPAAIVPIASFVMYLPVVIVPYAFMDDYSNMGDRHGLGGELWELSMRGGRPIGGLLLIGAYSATPDIDALRLVRLASLLAVAALGALLYFALRRGGVSRWLSTGISVSIISLPSIQVWVSWAVLFVAPIAALLSGVAALRASSAFGLPPGRATGRRVEATAVLLIALLVYQPAAMFFWVFLAIDTLRPSERFGRAARKIAAGVGVGGAAMALSFVAVKLGQHFYGSLQVDRSRLTQDIAGKLRWFVDEALVNALNLFDLTPTPRLAEAVAIVSLLGIALLHREKGWEAFGFVGISLLLVPLAYLPNLAVEESWASYRSLGALSSLLTVYVWLGLWGIVRAALTASPLSRATRWGVRAAAIGFGAALSYLAVSVILTPLWLLPEPDFTPSVFDGRSLGVFVLLLAVFAALGLAVTSRHFQSSRGTVLRLAPIAFCAAAGAMFVLTGSLLASRNITSLFVQPQNVELQLMRSTLARPGRQPLERAVFIRPYWSQGAAPLLRYDEFGLPSTFAEWVPRPAVYLIARETHRDARPEVEVLRWDTQPSPDQSTPGSVVVDMRNLERARVGWSLWSVNGRGGLPAENGPPS
jgi:hypothetical protein